MTLLSILRIVASDEILQIGEGHRMLFQREVHIRPQIVKPNIASIVFIGGAACEEQDIGLDALRVENSRRQTQNSMKIALVH